MAAGAVFLLKWASNATAPYGHLRLQLVVPVVNPRTASWLAGLADAAAAAGAAAADILSAAPSTAAPLAQDALKLLAGLLTAAKGWACNAGPSKGPEPDRTPGLNWACSRELWWKQDAHKLLACLLTNAKGLADARA